MAQWAFLSQTNKTKGKEKMAKTNRNIDRLIKLNFELRTICDKKEILEKSIVDFLRRLDITTDFVKELSKIQVMKLGSAQAEDLAKVLVAIHFPEVSIMWRDSRNYSPF